VSLSYIYVCIYVPYIYVCIYVPYIYVCIYVPGFYIALQYMIPYTAQNILLFVRLRAVRSVRGCGVVQGVFETQNDLRF